MASSSLFAALATWLTPLWLIGAGVLLALIVLGLLYAAAVVVAPAAAEAARSSLREGFLGPVLGLAVFMAGFAAVGSLMVPLDGMLRSLTQLPQTGDVHATIAVPPLAERDVLDLDVAPAQVKSIEISSDRPVELYAVEEAIYSYLPPREVRFDLDPQQPWNWTRGALQANPFSGQAAEMEVVNLSEEPATLTLRITLQPEFPQAIAIPITAVGLLVLVLGYLGLRAVFPKISAIASTTAKEATAQPLFQIVMALGVFLLLVSIYIPYNTFGEDVKILKDSGLTLIMVLAIIVAVWTASTTVADEIEGRTALTVLSKPVGRRQFILGKFYGILQPAALMFLFLGLLFLATVSYKVVYDSRESVLPDPAWQDCAREVFSIVPGLLLAYLKVVILASISVAISTRLPMLANLTICFAIYALGHLVAPLVQSSAGRFEIVKFVGQFLATLLPVLDHFTIEAAVSSGKTVPVDYLGWALLYCVLYSSVAMLLALALFEDRDLA